MIIILAPANIRTGGPELLHQLGYKLRLLGYDACMHYYGMKEGVNPVVPDYEKYNAPYIQQIVDSEENIIIFPEVAIEIIPYCTKKALPILWWLSVDNANLNDENIEIIRGNNRIIHLSQSQYSSDYVINELHIDADRVMCLSDYINSIFLNYESDIPRKDVVLFNPKKGWEFTRELITLSEGRFNWKPLSGMSPEEMRETLHTSKLYIDFGGHPGKDRMPREAALSGCCIVTGKKGSAGNSEDIPIDEKYKFNDDADKNEILNKISDIFANYESLHADFVNYVEKTKYEFIKFEMDTYKCFSNITGKEYDNESPEELINDMIALVSEEKYDMAFQKMVIFRCLGYEESEEFRVLEGYIRIGIGEFFEAEYVINEATKIYPDNSELYLLLARAILFNEEKGDRFRECLVACDKAIEKSMNTADRDVVSLEVMNIVEFIKKEGFLNR